jgi:hypothetical protein
MFEYLFYPAFFLVIGTTCSCVFLWAYGKYTSAFYINVFNSIGYLYLSIVLIIVGNSGLFAFKSIFVCFSIASLSCGVHLYTEMKKQKAGYEEVNNISDDEYISPLVVR